MIIKTLDFKGLCLDKLTSRVMADELLATLPRDQVSQSYLLQRVCEIASGLIQSEVEVLLKNSVNQYGLLRKQYAELEICLKEKNKENGELRLILGEKESDLNELQARNSALQRKIRDVEENFRENGRNCDFLTEKFERLCEKKQIIARETEKASFTEKENALQRKIKVLNEENFLLRDRMDSNNRKIGSFLCNLKATLLPPLRQELVQIKESCLSRLETEFPIIFKSFRGFINEFQAKTEYKMQTFEENLSKMRDFFSKTTNSQFQSLEKQKLSLETELSNAMKSLENLSHETHSLKQETQFLRQENYRLNEENDSIKRNYKETETRIEDVEERLREITQGVREYHQVSQKEKEELREKLDEMKMKREELGELRKRMKIMEKLVFEFRNLDSQEGISGFGEKVMGLKDKLAEIEEFSYRYSAKKKGSYNRKRLSLEPEDRNLFVY